MLNYREKPLQKGILAILNDMPEKSWKYDLQYQKFVAKDHFNFSDVKVEFSNINSKQYKLIIDLIYGIKNETHDVHKIEICKNYGSNIIERFKHWFGLERKIYNKLTKIKKKCLKTN